MGALSALFFVALPSPTDGQSPIEARAPMERQFRTEWQRPTEWQGPIEWQPRAPRPPGPSAPALAGAIAASDHVIVPGRARDGGWQGDAGFAAANALIGGLTAGTLQRLRDGSFSDGFLRGALGGVLAYGGRRAAAADFNGAGLLGRQLSAVGSSAVRNASEGRASFSHLTFPVGPVHLHLNRDADGTSERRVQPKLVLVDALWLLAVAAQPETRVDVSASLSAGAAVFRSPGSQIMRDGRIVHGMSGGGTILLGDGGKEQLAVTFPHERVHVLQHDFAARVWGDPVESYLADRTGVTRRVHRWLELGIAFPLAAAALNAAFGLEYERQPHEREAIHLAGQRR